MAAKNKMQVETILVMALAKGATAALAGEKADVSERTVYRFLRKPEFQARITAVKDEIFQRTVAVIATAFQGAIHTLVALQDPSTPASVRRGAARDIIELGQRLRESANTEKRLVALENGASAASVNALQTGPTLSVPSGKRRQRGDTALQVALACGNTVAQAAHKSHLSERTAYRRLQDPAFQQGIEAIRADMVHRAAAALNAAGQLAVKTLIDLQAATTPASVRRRAARDLIELGDSLRQATVVEKRLAALEWPAVVA